MRKITIGNYNSIQEAVKDVGLQMLHVDVEKTDIEEAINSIPAMVEEKKNKIFEGNEMLGICGMGDQYAIAEISKINKIYKEVESVLTCQLSSFAGTNTTL